MGLREKSKRSFEHIELRTVSVREAVYNVLKQAITEGDFAPGIDFKEVELSRELGVSRTPLREALQQLANEGLLRRLPSGTLRVMDLSVAEASRLIDVREALEGLVARTLAEMVRDGNLAREELKPIESLLVEMEASAEGPSRHLIRLGFQFHLMLSEKTQNKTLHRFLEQVISSLGRYRFILWDHPERRSHNVEAHRLILKNIREGDVGAAETEMKRHIRSSESTYLKLIDTIV